MPSAVRGPSAARERDAWAGGRLLVGVDEAGRGPLAGPVVAAAVAFPPFAPRLRGVRDSKVLSAARRASLAQAIRSRAAVVGIGAASPRLIDRVNIRVATAIAMRRAVRRALGLAPLCRVHLVVDGLPFPEIGLEHEALVDGDALCYTVAAAGIIAKTVRDRIMTRLAIRHPCYGWASNMGYGTPDHLTGLEVAGPTAHHRRSFAPVGQLRLSL
ncbi:MAG: Ribonuclease [Gemmatimonadetes bacterium]|nr:Ribonuclease [Gemmatimonadota bacterium]